MRYTTIIFDLDGTILNTLDDLTASVNYALEKCGYPTHTKEAVCGFVGNGIGKLMERSVPKDTSKEDIQHYHKVFTEHYKVHCADNTKPYDGIMELIDNYLILIIGFVFAPNIIFI